MKKIMVMLALAIAAHLSAPAQNPPAPNTGTVPNTTTNSINNSNNSYQNNTTPYGNPAGNYNNSSYDHSPTYDPLQEINTHSHYNQINNNLAPVNNADNNNTMTPYNNTTSPYDVTSPYFTPPNANAPLNNTPPVK